MVKYIKGDVLNCEATLVAHQVNAFGVMGGGIAAAIWPLLTQESQSAYVEKCRHDAKLPITEWMGSIQILDTKREGLEICNLFTQYPFLYKEVYIMKFEQNPKRCYMCSKAFSQAIKPIPVIGGKCTPGYICPTCYDKLFRRDKQE